VGPQASLAAFALLILTASCPAEAGGLSDCWLMKSDCKDMIGKRLWLMVPKDRPNGVEVTLVQHDWKNTIKLKGGSMLVIGAPDNGSYGHDLEVRLPDGRVGWAMADAFLMSETDPVENAKRQAAAIEAARQDCARRGPPKIGMTPAELIESCWRSPKRIVKKTTSSGVEESYVYTMGHIVRLTDGKVTEIVESR
jgi:uncharacterized protein YwbE